MLLYVNWGRVSFPRTFPGIIHHFRKSHDAVRGIYITTRKHLNQSAFLSTTVMECLHIGERIDPLEKPLLPIGIFFFPSMLLSHGLKERVCWWCVGPLRLQFVGESQDLVMEAGLVWWGPDGWGDLWNCHWLFMESSWVCGMSLPFSPQTISSAGC